MLYYHYKCVFKGGFTSVNTLCTQAPSCLPTCDVLHQRISKEGGKGSDAGEDLFFPDSFVGEKKEDFLIFFCQRERLPKCSCICVVKDDILSPDTCIN